MKHTGCTHCSGEMKFFGRERLQLGQTGWLLGDIPNLIAGALEVDIYMCSNCRKLEFFAAETQEDEENLPTRTCPKCGTVHDFDYPKCPQCGNSNI